jgi:hypothetical protein
MRPLPRKSQREKKEGDRFKKLIQVEGSKRYRVNDKLQIEDIAGARADVYGKQRHIAGKDYMDKTDDAGPSKNL